MPTLRDWPLFNQARRGLLRLLLDRKAESLLGVTRSFPAFAPCSAGEYVQLAELTVSSINRSFPILAELAGEVGARSLPWMPLAQFPAGPEEAAAARQLSDLFDRHGSDKGTELGYSSLYGPLLLRAKPVRAILEIGMGTTHTDTVSHMSTDKKTGGSLRAFRDFCPEAKIYGADIDRRILFQEARIQTFFVDQTSSEAFGRLAGQIPSPMNLIIDDGLHSPEANLQTLCFALPRLVPGGWVVIEDIGPAAASIWSIVAALLPSSEWDVLMLESPRALLFAVQRKT
jgi:hypothetical protein